EIQRRTSRDSARRFRLSSSVDAHRRPCPVKMQFCLDRMQNMERIGIYDARAKLSELIERVQAGEEVVLTRHGEPVARLVAEKPRRKPTGAAVVARIRKLAKKLDIHDVDVRKLIEQGRHR